MMHVARFALMSLFLAMLMACATPQSRRTVLEAKYPNWSKQTLHDVSWGLVKVGMTKEEVREALVVPQRYNLHLEGDTWRYVDDYRPSQAGLSEWGEILHFKNDRVVKINHFWSIPASLLSVEW